MRQHLVAVAMDQQHRRLVLQLRLQEFGAGQHAGEADDARELLLAPQSDMQRHHGALAEAHQHGLRFVEAVRGHGLVEEGVEHGSGGLHAGQRDRRIEAGDAEPLIAEGIAFAGLRRVGGVEHHVGHELAEQRRQADQVIAVGAVAVQQHDEVTGLALVVGAVARAFESGHTNLLMLFSPERSSPACCGDSARAPKRPRCARAARPRRS